MSLTLNDEQENALREWFLAVSSRLRSGTSVPTSEARDLADAIAPLMKPWHVSTDGFLTYIHGPDDIALTAPSGPAERICRVLNGEERW